MRIYTDTSVIGGCFDDEFAEDSRRLLTGVRSGKYRLLISEVVIRELAGAPDHVQSIVGDLLAQQVETLTIDRRALDLVSAYMDAGIVGPRWIDDATHVACATVAQADAHCLLEFYPHCPT